MKNDILGNDDVELFVNGFYQKVREDALLAPVFESKVAEAQWPSHLKKLYAFWNAILFSDRGFDGNPMQKHLLLPIDAIHFTQWLTLFNQTIDEHFAGPKADEAKKRAASIAQIMNFKINSVRKN